MDYEILTKELFIRLEKFHKMKPTVEFANFSQGEILVLNYLYENASSEELPSHISNCLCLSTARVAATLNSLEKKGYISRIMSSTDRRKIIVEITASGKEFISHKREKMKNVFRSMLTLLGEDDSKEFIRLLGRLETIVSEIMAATDFFDDYK